MVREKLLSVTLAVLLAFAAVPAACFVATDTAEAATTYSYTVSRPTVTVNGSKVHVTKFTIKSLGLVGTCCQAGTAAKNGKTTVKKLSNTDIRTKLIYYYGYQKGYLGKANKNGMLLGRALSWSSGNSKLKPITKSEVTKFINALPSNLKVPNRFEAYFCNPTNGSQNFVAYKMNPPAYVTLKKTSSDKNSLAAGTGYSFAGIEYTVYSGSTAVGKLTCNANGTTNKLTLDTGTYTIKETKTNAWYKLNTQTYTKTLKSGETWTVSASDSPQTGKVHIKKSVAGNYDGSLAFDFRLTNTANSSIVYSVRTDAQSGEADVNVIEGTYRCEEILPEDAEMVDMTGMQTKEVKNGETVTFERENKRVLSGTLQVSKSTNDGGSAKGFRFRITGTLSNQGEITADKILEAAAPSLKVYNEEMYSAGDWTVSDKEVDELNDAAKARETGVKTITIRNRLTYIGEEGISIADVLKDIKDDPEKGRIEQGTIIKEKDKVYKALEDAEYEIVYEEEGPDAGEDDPAKTIDQEKTEANIKKLLSSSSFDAFDTSDSDISVNVSVRILPVEYVYNSEEPELSGYETGLDNQIEKGETKTENKELCRVEYSAFEWHGAATLYQEVRDGKLTGKTETIVETAEDGLAPAVEEGITYGSFSVEEIMTDGQKERYKQPQVQTKTINEGDGPAAFVFKIENRAKWTDVTLVKTSEDGLISGITFLLEGKDNSGNDIRSEAVTDENGRIDFGRLYAGKYTISEVDFDPDRYEMNNRLDGYDVPAKEVIVTGEETEAITVDFENIPLKSLYLTKVDKASQIFLKNSVFALYEEEQQIAMLRIVQDDYGQAGIEMLQQREDSGLHVIAPQVSGFPEEDAGSGTADTEGDDDGEITVVSPTEGTGNDDAEEEGDGTDDEENDGDADAAPEYNFAVIKGLKEGKTYTLKEVTAPSGYAASINYSFTFEDGQKLVLENAAPEIATSAVDKKTKLHMSDPEGMVTVVDTVSYSNLGPGHTYLISGVLALKPDLSGGTDDETQDTEIIEVLKDANGKEITAQKEFVPEKENGTVDIEFTFDASLLDGKQAVAMEQLVDPALTGINGVITVVASHEDINDEAQTIYFPAVETSASADDTGKRITEADQDIVITDVVRYSNVEAGRIYDITGTLMDQETGEPILSGGKKVTSQIQFKATKDGPVFAQDGLPLEESLDGETELVSGTVELKFHLDGSALNGTGAVAFEKLMTNGKVVGEHSDIHDEKQTVYLPGINTNAKIKENGIVADEVEYTNLLPGETYVIHGTLMDKSTGGELILNGSPVTAQMEFVPEKKNGSVTIEFPVDQKALQGKTAVVFEVCSIITETEEGPLETEVISHKDINNKAQTVTFHVPQTGQHGPWMLLAPSFLIAAAGIYTLIRRLRRGGGLW